MGGYSDPSESEANSPYSSYSAPTAAEGASPIDAPYSPGPASATSDYWSNPANTNAGREAAAMANTQSNPTNPSPSLIDPSLPGAAAANMMMSAIAEARSGPSTYTDQRTGEVFANQQIAYDLGRTPMLTVGGRTDPYAQGLAAQTTPADQARYMQRNDDPYAGAKIGIPSGVSQPDASAQYLNRQDIYAVTDRAQLALMATGMTQYQAAESLRVQAQNMGNRSQERYYDTLGMQAWTSQTGKSAAYHTWSADTNLPQKANPYEYSADLLTYVMKGYPTQDKEKFSPVNYEVLNLAGGKGQQAYVWTNDKYDLRFAMDVVARVEKSGELGPYGQLKSYSSGYGYLDIGFQQGIAAKVDAGRAIPEGVSWSVWGATQDKGIFIPSVQQNTAKASVAQPNPTYGGVTFTSIALLGKGVAPISPSQVAASMEAGGYSSAIGAAVANVKGERVGITPTSPSGVEIAIGEGSLPRPFASAGKTIAQTGESPIAVTIDSLSKGQLPTLGSLWESTPAAKIASTWSWQSAPVDQTLTNIAVYMSQNRGTSGLLNTMAVVPFLGETKVISPSLKIESTVANIAKSSTGVGEIERGYLFNLKNGDLVGTVKGTTSVIRGEDKQLMLEGVDNLRSVKELGYYHTHPLTGDIGLDSVNSIPSVMDITRSNYSTRIIGKEGVISPDVFVQWTPKSLPTRQISSIDRMTADSLDNFVQAGNRYGLGVTVTPISDLSRGVSESVSGYGYVGLNAIRGAIQPLPESNNQPFVSTQVKVQDQVKSSTAGITTTSPIGVEVGMAEGSIPKPFVSGGKSAVISTPSAFDSLENANVEISKTLGLDKLPTPTAEQYKQYAPQISLLPFAQSIGIALQTPGVSDYMASYLEGEGEALLKNPVNAAAAFGAGFALGVVGKGVEVGYGSARVSFAAKAISEGGGWRAAEQYAANVPKVAGYVLGGAYVVSVAARTTNMGTDFSPASTERLGGIMGTEAIPGGLGVIAGMSAPGAVYNAARVSDIGYKSSIQEGMVTGRFDYYVKQPISKPYELVKIDYKSYQQEGGTGVSRYVIERVGLNRLPSPEPTTLKYEPAQTGELAEVAYGKQGTIFDYFTKGTYETPTTLKYAPSENPMSAQAEIAYGKQGTIFDYFTKGTYETPTTLKYVPAESGEISSLAYPEAQQPLSMRVASYLQENKPFENLQINMRYPAKEIAQTNKLSVDFNKAYSGKDAIIREPITPLSKTFSSAVKSNVGRTPSPYNPSTPTSESVGSSGQVSVSVSSMAEPIQSPAMDIGWRGTPEYPSLVALLAPQQKYRIEEETQYLTLPPGMTSPSSQKTSTITYSIPMQEIATQSKSAMSEVSSNVNVERLVYQPVPTEISSKVKIEPFAASITNLDSLTDRITKQTPFQDSITRQTTGQIITPVVTPIIDQTQNKITRTTTLITPIIPLLPKLSPFFGGGGGSGGGMRPRGPRHTEIFTYAPKNLKGLYGMPKGRTPAIKKKRK